MLDMDYPVAACASGVDYSRGIRSGFFDTNKLILSAWEIVVLDVDDDNCAIFYCKTLRWLFRTEGSTIGVASFFPTGDIDIMQNLRWGGHGRRLRDERPAVLRYGALCVS